MKTTENSKETRIFIRILAVVIGFVAILAVLYLFFGAELVRRYYEGITFGGLLSPVHKHGRSLEAYTQLAAERFWQNVVIGIPLSLLTIFGLYKLYKALFRRVRPLSDLSAVTPAAFPKYGGVVAGLLYTLLTLLYFYPAFSHFATNMIGPPEDNMICLWTLSYASQHLFNGGLAYVKDLFYPEGAAFTFHAWSYYNVFFFSILSKFLGYVSAYNLLIMHTFPFAGVAGYYFTRYFTRNHWLALLGGFLFAFNPAHFARAEHHMNIATIQFIPLFVLFYVKTIRRESRWAIGWATLFLLLNALVDWNYLLYAGTFVLLGYLYLAIRNRRLWLPHTFASSAVILGLTGLVLSPLLIPILESAAAGTLHDAGGHNQYVVDLAAFVIPAPVHLLGAWEWIVRINHSFTAWYWETTGYLGLAALLIVLLNARKLLRDAAALILGFISFALLALGAQPHFLGKLIPAFVPGRIIPMIPLLSNARAPSRNIVYAYLFWSVLVAMAAGYFWQSCSGRRARLLCVTVIAALLLVDYSSFSRASTPVELPACYQALPRDVPAYGVLDLPSGYQPVERYMMYQMLHGLPIVQGWVSRRVDSSLVDQLELHDLGKQMAQLKRARVKYIVLHKRYLPDPQVDPRAYHDTYEQVYEDDQAIVYQVY